MNHIYALAEQKSPKTGPAILKLSEILRYAIRNLDEQKVSLGKELNYIRQYIELYKSRMRHPERIRLQIEEPSNDLTIPPLLLIVLIENCFKHGSIKNEGEEITISIAMEHKTLVLETQNSIDEHRELPKESAGLGLENAKRRLNLLYPEKHRLSVENEAQTFIVNLSIQLS